MLLQRRESRTEHPPKKISPLAGHERRNSSAWSFFYWADRCRLKLEEHFS